MSLDDKEKAIESAQGCVLCTDWTHKVDKCDAKFGNKPWKNCNVKENSGKVCGKKHHNLLHGSTHAYVVNMIVSAAKKKPRDIVPEEENQEVLLLTMKLSVMSEKNKTVESITFFDSGSSMCLVREAFAKSLNLSGQKVALNVQVVGQNWSIWETTRYSITLLDNMGFKHPIKALVWTASLRQWKKSWWIKLCINFQKSVTK